MASQQQIYETKILLNSEQAKREIINLEKKVDELKRKRQQALDAGDTKSWQKLNKEVEKHETRLRSMQGRLQSISKTLDNMSAAGPKQLKDTIKDINALLNSGTIERGSRQWDSLTASLKQAKTELAKINDETKASQTAWQRFTKFLNDSWGGLTMLMGSVAGISMTIRKTVQDFAKMEEAMADTRKYTGLEDTAIRELNEDLKKMDTRTSREELNELAGVAGRLGITSKAAILDFVDAANQIKVALGDDLGEGAIDNVGKLAMAFGEDERMGLRGAMLATGSAVNELAQNSSAQAGYLVDFTARVAGFGKQLGLTQAQIMGFGAVMDENLLRDEMAATAFGNMLTKMQTDTAKFARIAGMEVKEFTDLLNNDANAAILALADSLRKADPQNMMKMLDDMGLDGSRAVGVLSTMADKIDDVRARQQLATRAYEEGTSVGKEYDTMNNTVEAGIEKCKKQFQEMAVELGEKLVPVVRYTISSTALLTKGLSSVLNFVFENIGAITKLSVILAEYVAVKKLHYLWTQRNVAVEKVALALDKAQIAVRRTMIGLRKTHTIAMLAYNGAITKTVALQRIWNEVLRKNPIGLAVTAVVLLTGAFWKLADAINASGQKQRIVNDLHKKAAEKVAEEKAEISQLLRVARDEKEQLDKRKEAIEKLNSIIPGYNGQLDETTGKYTENATALKAYNTLLKEKYRLEAAEDKLKELEKKRFKEDLDYEEKMRESQERVSNGGTALNRWAATQGPQAEGTVSEKAYQEQLTRDHEKQNAILQKQIDIVTGVRDATKEVVDFNNQMTSLLEKQRKILEGEGTKKVATDGTSPYVSDADRKKQEREQRKAEADRKKREAEERKALQEQSKQLKAETDQRLADELVSYSLGLTNYLQYLEKRKQIQLDGIAERKRIFAGGSAEWLRLDAEEKELLAHGDDESRKMSLKELERNHQMTKAMMEAQFNDEKSILYHNEDELNEALFQEDMQFLKEKAELYQKGSLERMQIEWEMEDLSEKHQLEMQQNFAERLQQVRQNYLQQGNEMQRDIELNALKKLLDKKLLQEEEYQKARLAIQAKYARTPAQDTKDTFTEKVSDSLSVARENAGDANQGNPWTGDLTNFISINEELKKQYKAGELDYSEYLAAKAQNLQEFLDNVTEKYGATFEQVKAVYNAANAYAKASSDYEIAVTEKKYDQQIAAAGNNQRKVKKLEEQKQKEVAAIKTKANKRAMKIEIAQALASTAMGAINAYSSAAEVPLIGYILAPIAAAAAVAAGMLQVATIKKQHQTEELGYYEGGFTGGRRYRKEAGVVHEGEFVANHQAVQNPAILPFLNFLDQAQRNNTVGSLTAEDVSRSMGGGSNQIVTPIVNVQSDNEELRDELARMRDASDLLLLQLQQPINAQVVLTGPDGLNAKQDLLDRMLKNK